VFLADGGGGSTLAAPSYGGTQTLKIDPATIPAALRAFQEAHDRVSKKLSQLDGMAIRPWAADEVSGQTAMLFAERTRGGGGDSAIACLTRYQEQLAAACKSLQEAHATYLAMEGANSERWGKYDAS
jgi:PE family